jgi:GT2 family glycosyltransferase
VYVGCGSPRKVRRALEQRARGREIELIASPYYLSPNEARNLGMKRVATRHVVFVDNDCIVEAGWIDRLVGCAEKSGAAAVIPILCWENGLVHTAGNIMRIADEGGKRHLVYELEHDETPIENVRGTLQSKRIDAVEFHCVLLRADMLRKTGPFDEDMLSTREHCDFSLALKDAGGEVYLDSDTVIYCMRPPPFEWWDIPYYLLRWSSLWNDASLRRLNAKWGLQDDYAGLTDTWLTPVRQRALSGLRRTLVLLLGIKLGGGIMAVAENCLIQYAITKRPQPAKSV